MKSFRYSEWDGSQEIFELDKDELMNELGRQMMQHGDLARALRALRNRGLNPGRNREMPSLDRLLEQLQRLKESRLNRYNLDSVMDEIRQKLDEILKTEREGIQEKLEETRQKAQADDSELSQEMRDRLLKNMEERAAQNREKLDGLPSDIGGQIKELTEYDFMDEDARNQFNELLDMLKKQAMEQFGQSMLEQLKNMDPTAMSAMRHMIEALNQMLEQRLRGETPDFEDFMKQFGGFFGDNPPQNLEELAEDLQNRIGQAQALMDSLSPEVRKELQDLLDNMLDEATKYELAKMASHLQRLYPNDDYPGRFPFTGEESISYREAMKLMETLQKMDRLEEQLEMSRDDPSRDNIDEGLLEELMGEDARRELEAVREIAKLLEEAGYITKKGDKYELTPRGIRKIGQQALEHIFSDLKRDRLGGHQINHIGWGSEIIEETKKYEFGDDFNIHIQRSIMNSLVREPAEPPVKLEVQDLEVLKTEESTRSATVIMLDQSLSMFFNGYFDAAKQVTLALESLIKTRYPKDVLHVVTFSRRAREVTGKDLLLKASLQRGDQGTNYQDAFRLARKLLSNLNYSNKEIILVSDGEPTAHYEGKQIYFQYPPSLRTLQMTMREVRACTAKRIVINTFMMDYSPFFASFVTQMARLNKGRVFFTSPRNLGEYVLMDFLSNKQKKIG